MHLSKLLSGFREKVKEEFKTKRFSAEMFSSMLGVDVDRYRKWERGALPNSDEDRAAIRKFFEIENLDDVPETAVATGLAKLDFAERRFLAPILDYEINSKTIDASMAQKPEIDYREKYYASLEQQVKSSELVLKTANAAIEAAQAATKLAEGLAIVDELRETVRANASKLEALRGWVSKNLSDPLQKLPSEIEAEIHIAYNELEKSKRMGIPAGIGT